MAKKKQTVVAVAEDPRELEKTIVVNDKVYNINAVAADHAVEADHSLEADHSVNANQAINAGTAAKVAKKLIINKIGNSGSTVIDFDGSEEKAINVVPAEGGKFNGNIAVPSASPDEIKANGELVINYNDIVNNVVDKLINTSTMATWDDTNKKVNFLNNAPAINGICVITGSGQNEAISNFATYNKVNKILPYYLYINIDTGNIWLGNYNTDEVTKLARDAHTAAQLAQPTHFSVSLDTSDTADFNGNGTDITLGVQGILPSTKGGTGQNNLENVTVGKAKQLYFNPTIQTNLSSVTATSFNGTTNITPGVTGILPPAYGGTGVSKLSDVTVGNATNATKAINADNATNAINATNDSDGKQINKNYYRSATTFGSVTNTITISSAEPSGGSNGDIWIRY